MKAIDLEGFRVKKQEARKKENMVKFVFTEIPFWTRIKMARILLCGDGIEFYSRKSKAEIKLDE